MGEQMLAVSNCEREMVKVLLARSLVHERRPVRFGETDTKARRAFEICLNAHRHGGCTPGQLKDLEKIAQEIEGAAQ